ncbi:MAG: serine hydrolase domain-containing protein [bacterium]
MRKIEFESVLDSSADAVTVLVHNEHDQWNNIGFLFEKATPNKLIGIRVEPGEPPSDAPRTPLSESAALDSIRGTLEMLSKSDAFSGVVLIAKQGTPIYRQAYGLAEREFDVPNRVDTKFNLGSINKIFTQIAIRQLAAQGKLALTDTLGKFLPDYPNPQARAKVTVQQLMEHTSGIGDFFGERFVNLPKDKLRGIQDYLPLFADQPLEFEPGTGNRYSNGGYIVLGALIEKVSGRSYYDYVREHIFKLAGMENTDSYEADEVIYNRAMGYTHHTGFGETPELRKNTYQLPARDSSAGGGYSTADDLLKFLNAVDQGKIPGAQSEAMAIAGGAPGINTMVSTKIKDLYTVIVMTNLDPPTAQDASDNIWRLLKRVN